MRKEEQYELVRYKIETGAITNFEQIFNYVRKTVVAADLHSSTRHLTRICKYLEEVRMADVYGISKLIGVEMEVIFDMVKHDLLVQKGEISKTKKVS